MACRTLLLEKVEPLSSDRLVGVIEDGSGWCQPSFMTTRDGCVARRRDPGLYPCFFLTLWAAWPLGTGL